MKGIKNNKSLKKTNSKKFEAKQKRKVSDDDSENSDDSISSEEEISVLQKFKRKTDSYSDSDSDSSSSNFSDSNNNIINRKKNASHFPFANATSPNEDIKNLNKKKKNGNDDTYDVLHDTTAKKVKERPMILTRKVFSTAPYKMKPKEPEDSINSDIVSKEENTLSIMKKLLESDLTNLDTDEKKKLTAEEIAKHTNASLHISLKKKNSLSSFHMKGKPKPKPSMM